jgi:cob(I)alamin adenosyltransferase
MSYRLTQIYTGTGDDGATSLAGGERVPKDCARIEAIGAIDELNSVLGLLLTEELPEDLRLDLQEVQHRLFDVGGELSLPGHALLAEAEVDYVEKRMDTLNASIPPLEDFVLPGGNRPAALCHLARTVCRRAERRLVTLARQEEVPQPVRKYLNRLSDFLFVAARVINRASGGPEILWQPARKPTGGPADSGS